MMYPTVLHLEFVFWTTWQIREQTWLNCQAIDGLAKARSRASSGPPRDPDISSRHICSIDREFATETPGPPDAAVRSQSKWRGTPSRAPTLHAPPSATDCDRLHRVETPSPRARRYNWRRGYLGAQRSRPRGKEPRPHATWKKIRIRVQFR